VRWRWLVVSAALKPPPLFARRQRFHDWPECFPRHVSEVPTQLA
jgi:hypothetical protein